MSEVQIIPVSTRILTPKDDIADIMLECGKELGPDDIITVAESVVAITQGRILRYEDMRPSFAARTLNRLIAKEGSLASIYGMHALMLAEGQLRVAFAMLLGIVSKFFGLRGVFYRLCGEQGRLIDDVSGTCPPFDKYIVYGPGDPEIEVDRIHSKLKCFGVAIADVNDLKRALIVASTDGIDDAVLSRLFIDNPFGNGNEKRPICIVKNFRQAMENSRADAKATVN